MRDHEAKNDLITLNISLTLDSNLGTSEMTMCAHTLSHGGGPSLSSLLKDTVYDG